MRQIICYFAPISGFAYLGHARLLEIAGAAGAEVIFRPFDSLALFEAQGTVPPARQPPERQAWRRADMVRWAARLGLPLTTAPAHWPVPPGLAARALLAAEAMGYDAGHAAGAVLAAVWAQERNVADPEALAAVFRSLDWDGAAIVARAKTHEMEQALSAVHREAMAAGVFGSPTYLVGEALFFGQDRLDFVAEALAGC